MTVKRGQVPDTAPALQKTIKDLILFDSVWKKRDKLTSAKKIPKKALQRIAIYKDLVSGTLSNVMLKIYPTIYKLLKSNWQKIISLYIENFPPRSPILFKIGEHFPEFLSHKKDIQKKYPFIHELALYEWLEVDLLEREEKNHTPKGGFKLNPVHEICGLEYPIPYIAQKLKHHNNINYLNRISKIKKNQTNLFAYRDPKDLSVRFFELSDATLQFIELIKMGFKKEIIIKTIAIVNGVDENDLTHLRKQANELIKTLKKNRILL